MEKKALLQDFPDELQEQFKLAKALGSSKGFFQRYFYHLKRSRTNHEAFLKTNEEYFELFGEYKYSSLDSFRKTLQRYYGL
ncbi:MAG: hypothetical protein AAF934_00310 [Bacteroidota bacterium]